MSSQCPINQAGSTASLHGLIDYRFQLGFFYLLVLLAGGTLQHLFAWRNGSLEIGQFDAFLALTWIWWVEQLYYYGHLNPRFALQALDDIRPMLDLDDEGFKLLSYEFIMTPSSPVLVLQILGVLFCLIIATVVSPD